MTPGETALTRMPREAYSMARERVAEARPPLVSAVSAEGTPEFAYSARGGRDVDDVATVRFSISGMARWVSRKNPVRLTPTTVA
jgi:hypothetical protein